VTLRALLRLAWREGRASRRRLLLLVAAIAVFIVTYVDLVSRRRTIGIERAIGIGGGAIVLGYVLKAVVFAVVGVVVGGLLFVQVAVPVVAAHPFRFPIGPVSLSVTG